MMVVRVGLTESIVSPQIIHVRNYPTGLGGFHGSTRGRSKVIGVLFIFVQKSFVLKVHLKRTETNYVTTEDYHGLKHKRCCLAIG
jgi:hypothetical protein